MQLDMSAKAKLCRLYLENPAMFSRFSKKYAGVDFYYIKHANKPDVPILQAVRRYHEGMISHVTSIADLSENQCNVLIEHIGGIQNEYRHLLDYNLTLPSHDTTIANAIEFALNRYIPMMLTFGKFDYASRLSIRYLIRVLGREQVLMDINEVIKKDAIVKTNRDNNQKLSHESYNLDHELGRIQPQIQSLKEDLQKINSFIAEEETRVLGPESKDNCWQLIQASNAKKDLSLAYIVKRARIEEEIHKLKAQEKDLLQRKEQLEKELDQSDLKLQEQTNQFAQEVTMLPSFGVLYNQRDNILRKIRSTEQIIVNYLWLHYPETMHGIEKYKYGWYDFQVLGRGLNPIYILPKCVLPAMHILLCVGRRKRFGMESWGGIYRV